MNGATTNGAPTNGTTTNGTDFRRRETHRLRETARLAQAPTSADARSTIAFSVALGRIAASVFDGSGW